MITKNQSPSLNPKILLNDVGFMSVYCKVLMLSYQSMINVSKCICVASIAGSIWLFE